jgi:hypothetical protein
MGKSPIEIMIDSSDLKCTVCGTSSRVGCDCWTKCSRPGCKWSYRKGAACNNPEHRLRPALPSQET